jgi:hypothetical protein
MERLLSDNEAAEVLGTSVQSRASSSPNDASASSAWAAWCASPRAPCTSTTKGQVSVSRVFSCLPIVTGLLSADEASEDSPPL